MDTSVNARIVLAQGQLIFDFDLFHGPHARDFENQARHALAGAFAKILKAAACEVACEAEILWSWRVRDKVGEAALSPSNVWIASVCIWKEPIFASQELLSSL